MAEIGSPARAIVRNVLVIVGVLLILYIIYLLRKPISWLIIAAFLAIAVAGPVNFFQRYMKRGLAIALTYLCVLAIPIGLGAVLIPPIVNQVSDVATNAPNYVNDVEDYVQKNKTLNDLNEKYDITQKLSDEAEKLPSKAGDAAKVLRDIGFGLVSSIFAGVTPGRDGSRSSSGCRDRSTPSESSGPCAGSRMRSATTSEARCCRRRSRASPRSSCSGFSESRSRARWRS
jgi:predicted PurR-regulated permease PerM